MKMTGPKALLLEVVLSRALSPRHDDEKREPASVQNNVKRISTVDGTMRQTQLAPSPIPENCCSRSGRLCVSVCACACTPTTQKLQETGRLQE